jgi:hypothetical protein
LGWSIRASTVSALSITFSRGWGGDHRLHGSSAAQLTR